MSHQIHFTHAGFVTTKRWASAEYDELQQRIKVATTGKVVYQNFTVHDSVGTCLSLDGRSHTPPVLDNFTVHGFPRQLDGQTVLDIGCNAGYYSFACLARGAQRVVGIDIGSGYLAQASVLKDALGLGSAQIDFVLGDEHVLEPTCTRNVYDFIINTGVMYHLQDPVHFLRLVAQACRGTMFVESEMLIDPKFEEHAWFIETTYEGDATNWWIYGPKCLERMCRAAGFLHVEFKGFIWHPSAGALTKDGLPKQGRGVLVCRK